MRELCQLAPGGVLRADHLRRLVAGIHDRADQHIGRGITGDHGAVLGKVHACRLNTGHSLQRLFDRGDTAGTTHAGDGQVYGVLVGHGKSACVKPSVRQYQAAEGRGAPLPVRNRANAATSGGARRATACRHSYPPAPAWKVSSRVVAACR